MNKIGKISTVKRKSSGAASIRNSLTGAGLQRYPNALVALTPFKEPDGSYRTGLDENATYIKRMVNETAREDEIRTVRALKEMVDKYVYDVDLSPKSEFYTKMFINWGKEGYCRPYNMIDGDNLFHLEQAQQLITYAWLRVHPKIAPSSAALSSGKYSRCDFYVNDSDVAEAQAFKIKSAIAKAIKALGDLGPTKTRQVARQCGFTIVETDRDEAVFNKLYDYIQEAMEPNKSHNLTVFNNFVELSDESLTKRDTIKQALTLGVIKNFKNAIYRGNNRVAANEEEYTEFLLEDKNQDDFFAIEQELKIKKSQTNL